MSFYDIKIIKWRQNWCITILNKGGRWNPLLTPLTTVKVTGNSRQTKRVFFYSFDVHGFHATHANRGPSPRQCIGVHHSPIIYNVFSLGLYCPMSIDTRPGRFSLGSRSFLRPLATAFCTNHSLVHHRVRPTLLPDNHSCFAGLSFCSVNRNLPGVFTLIADVYFL